MKVSIHLTFFALFAFLAISFTSSKQKKSTCFSLTNIDKNKAITNIIENGNCSWNNINLYGKVQIVDAFPDIKVQIVDAFPDIKVKWVESFPDDCGKWQKVEAFPDFKIQLVDAFPDIRIENVDAFPGMQ